MIELEIKRAAEQNPLDLQQFRQRIFFDRVKALLNDECPLNFPTPCSMLDGGPFGELAQAELEGMDLLPFRDVKAVTDKCTDCRIFVEEAKDLLRQFPG